MPKESLQDRARSRPLFFRIVVLLGAAMLGAYLFTGAMIWRYGTSTKDWGWSLGRRDGQWIVGQVDSQGPAAGKLQAGDVILAINDDPGIRRIDADFGRVWSVVVRAGSRTTCGSPKVLSCFTGCSASGALRTFRRSLTIACRSMPAPGSLDSM
jgi:hypothetical protein